MCLMRSVYHTQYSELQEIFDKFDVDKFEAELRQKCYTKQRYTEILCKLNKNEGDFILTWNSGVSDICIHMSV